MKCSMHKGNEASGACVYCGKFFCSDCLIEVSGKMYCRKDVSKAMDEIKSNSNNNPMVFMNAGSVSGQGQNLVPVKSKTTAAILALFGGGFGFHKFYLGRSFAGLIYLVFCWTFIPCFLAVIDMIILLTMSEQSFAKKYGGR